MFLFSDGELYTGTVSSFQGNEPVIYKSLGQTAALKTENSLNWLQGTLPVLHQMTIFLLYTYFMMYPTKQISPEV